MFYLDNSNDTTSGYVNVPNNRGHNNRGWGGTKFFKNPREGEKIACFLLKDVFYFK